MTKNELAEKWKQQNHSGITVNDVVAEYCIAQGFTYAQSCNDCLCLLKHDALAWIGECDDAKHCIPAGYKRLADMTMQECENAWLAIKQIPSDKRTKRQADFMWWYLQSSTFSWTNMRNMLVYVGKAQDE